MVASAPHKTAYVTNNYSAYFKEGVSGVLFANLKESYFQLTKENKLPVSSPCLHGCRFPKRILEARVACPSS